MIVWIIPHGVNPQISFQLPYTSRKSASRSSYPLAMSESAAMRSGNSAGLDLQSLRGDAKKVNLEGLSGKPAPSLGVTSLSGISHEPHCYYLGAVI